MFPTTRHVLWIIHSLSHVALLNCSPFFNISFKWEHQIWMYYCIYSCQVSTIIRLAWVAWTQNICFFPTFIFNPIKIMIPAQRVCLLSLFSSLIFIYQRSCPTLDTCTNKTWEKDKCSGFICSGSKNLILPWEKKNVNECFTLLCKSGNLNWRGEVRDTGSSVATFPFSAAWRILFSSGRNYCSQSLLSSLTPWHDRGESEWSALTGGRDWTAGHQGVTWISHVSGGRPINVVIWVTEAQREACTDTFAFSFLLL